MFQPYSRDVPIRHSDDRAAPRNSTLFAPGAPVVRVAEPDLEFVAAVGTEERDPFAARPVLLGLPVVGTTDPHPSFGPVESLDLVGGTHGQSFRYATDALQGSFRGGRIRVRVGRAGRLK